MQRKPWQMVEWRGRPLSAIHLFRSFTLGASLFLQTVMQNLRERGIYSLADGREFVVHAVFRGGYVFYAPEDWDLFGPHAYESSADGWLRRWHGRPDQWRTEDLIDTGRTARSRSPENS
jgi:hypothetical protein